MILLVEPSATISYSSPVLQKRSPSLEYQSAVNAYIDASYFLNSDLGPGQFSQVPVRAKDRELFECIGIALSSCR
jgi:hypothetical protein